MMEEQNVNHAKNRGQTLLCWISSLCLICTFSLLVFVVVANSWEFSEQTAPGIPLNISSWVSLGRSGFQSGSSILSSVLNATVRSPIFASTFAARPSDMVWGGENNSEWLHSLHPAKAKKSRANKATWWCPAWKPDCTLGLRDEDANASRFWERRYVGAEEYYRTANMTCTGAGQSLEQHQMEAIPASSNIVTFGQKRFVADVHPALLLEDWGLPDMAQDYNEASQGRWIKRYACSTLVIRVWQTWF
jgi:hypothetical protein